MKFDKELFFKDLKVDQLEVQLPNNVLTSAATYLSKEDAKEVQSNLLEAYTELHGGTFAEAAKDLNNTDDITVIDHDNFGSDIKALSSSVGAGEVINWLADEVTTAPLVSFLVQYEDKLSIDQLRRLKEAMQPIVDAVASTDVRGQFSSVLF